MLRNWVANRPNPQSLFAAGEQGFLYDLGDLSSMYQDAAGTTAAAVGQGAGFVGDKRYGLAVTGAELVTNGTPTASTTGWSGTGTAVLTATAGGLRVENGAAATAGGNQTLTTVIGKTYKLVFDFTGKTTGNDAVVRARNATTLAVLATRTVSTVANGYVLIFTATSTDTQLQSINTSATLTDFHSINNISSKELPGNHALQATAGNRPPVAQDASGFRCLTPDGLDDFLSIATLDLSASDKLTLVMGVRKASDAAIGALIETSVDAAAADGSFHVLAPNAAATPGYLARARGTVASAASVSTGYVAPVSNVVTALFDIAGDSVILRINGTQVAASVTDLGTGNFASQVAYLFRRAGTSLPFSGSLYAALCRGGAIDANQLALAERWAASKMGLTW